MAPHKVRVNAISPGLIEAGLIQSEERKKMSAEIPYGRPAHQMKFLKCSYGCLPVVRLI